MNDNAITITISKIHSTLLTFFFIVAFIFFSLFMFLQNGIYIDKLVFPSIKIEKLYIKWNKKLSLSADNFYVTSSNTKSNSSILFSDVSKYLLRYQSLIGLINDITVNNLHVNDDIFRMRYTNKVLHIKGKIDEFSIESDVHLTKKNILLHVSNISSQQYALHVNGNIFYSLGKQALRAELNTSIADEISTTVYLDMNDTFTQYTAVSLKDITTLDTIASTLKIDKEISIWFVEYLNKRCVKLNNVYGYIKKNKYQSALNNIDIAASVYDVNYTFAENFNPISSKKVDLKFKNSHLIIEPKEAMFYNNPLNDSSVDIDFSKENVYLSILLNTKAKVDQTIVDLLKYYTIDLPFVQTKGLVDTHLLLGIDLATNQVTANGKFKSSKSQIAFNSTLLDVNSTEVALFNTRVNIKSLSVSKEDWLNASINGLFDASKHTGFLDANITKFLPLKDKTICLNKQKPISLQYRFDPKGDTIAVKENSIKAYAKEFHFSSFIVPFNFNTLSLALTGVECHYGDFSKFYLSGDVDLLDLNASLGIDVFHYNLNGLRLNQTILPIQVNYNKLLYITSKEESHLLLNNVATTIQPLHIKILDTKLHFNNISFNVNNFIQASSSGQYDFSKHKGSIKLHNINITDKKIGSLFKDNKNTVLNLKVKNNALRIKIPRYALTFSSYKSGWIVSLNDISTFAKNSKLMMEYNITKGSISLSSADNKNVRIGGEIQYPYALTISKDKDIKIYKFSGNLNKNGTTLTINSHSKLRIKNENIYFNSDKVTFNLMEIMHFIEDHTSDTNETSNTKIFIHAKNSKIQVSKKSTILADNLDIEKNANYINAQLKYKEGGAIFEMENNLFFFFGKNFNDEFVNAFSTLDDIHGGEISFIAKGSPKKFNGAFKIKNTLLKNYRLLNNILAFINTIPSLTTFSLPHYDQKGLPVSEAYAGFSLKDHKVVFSDISIDSHELDIVGNGYIHLKKKYIDMDLELQTDLGSKISQIPMVGYLIFGEGGRVSTTLKIKGPLKNPKVENALATDIVVAPFNIIKRTLTYPFKIYKDSLH